ncbi:MULTISPECIES: DUF6406 domain-containing protein [unclassified Spirillospora]|uniref:DUF6406 domain-containing protein n=1 Tax=unclassified Spirillospora TaxID=2642701 RepID=UPI0037169810
MAIEEIGLRDGRQAHLDADMKIGVFNIHAGGEGGPLEVVVAVKDDNEHKFTLRPGDTFPVGDQTWRLDRVIDPGGDGSTAVFARIE